MNKQETITQQMPDVVKKPMTISELAKLHLTDQSHTTTDAELRDATLELTESVEVDEENLYEVDNETVIPAMDFEKSDEEKRDDDEEDRYAAPNPYDVLS